MAVPRPALYGHAVHFLHPESKLPDYEKRRHHLARNEIYAGGIKKKHITVSTIFPFLLKPCYTKNIFWIAK